MRRRIPLGYTSQLSEFNVQERVRKNVFSSHRIKPSGCSYVYHRSDHVEKLRAAVICASASFTGGNLLTLLQQRYPWTFQELPRFYLSKRGTSHILFSIADSPLLSCSILMLFSERYTQSIFGKCTWWCKKYASNSPSIWIGGNSSTLQLLNG